MTDVTALMQALMVTGHVGSSHKVTLGIEPSEHVHKDCLFTPVARSDAEDLIAAIGKAGFRLVPVDKRVA